MPSLRSFASDNNAGIHPLILQAIAVANEGHSVAYGDDPITARSEKLFRQHFGECSSSFLVFNGTGANVLSLAAMARPYEAVVCSEFAHIHVDECGAPEHFTGSKLLPVPAPNGKLTIESIEKAIHRVGDQHHVQPKVISLAQTTEMGTVYTAEELHSICNFAHARSMLVHMDGARLANAAASLKTTLMKITGDVGIDALSFGGTKNGLMGGEAVVFFRPELAERFKFIRKQGMQLASKMRFVSAQFAELLSNDLWLRNASHANAMARLLENGVRKIAAVRVTQKVQANAVFAVLPEFLTKKLCEKYFFYIWNAERGEVRWMCSFDTTEQDVEDFVRSLQEMA
jgi:threonine aldolase